MAEVKFSEDQIADMIHDLIEGSGGDPSTFEGDLISQQIQTSLKLIQEGHDVGQLKLMTRSMKELRYAYRVFNEYPHDHRVSIFGSARTPEDHPDFLAAKDFSIGMAKEGWTCITGAANGIMKAGMHGHPEGSYGLSIRLPFEDTSNTLIEGDPKLISFRYFFTRKLMFMSHSDALAAFPGGFGTLDELYEMLTLMQTGKGNIIPVVLMEGVGGVYWHHWDIYMKKNQLENGWISPQDRNLYYIAPTVQDGIDHIKQFYKRYHSSRFVGENFVIRLNHPITEKQLKELNKKYAPLVKTGEMMLCDALPEESDHPDLQRIVFHFIRKDFGTLRALIDDINLC